MQVGMIGVRRLEIWVI